MKPVQNDPYSAHQDVLLLLPWYVNKTLQGAELNLVEAHLKVCLTCKREVVSLQNLALKVNQPGAFDTAEQAAFAQLKKRLHQTRPISPTVPMQVATIVAAPKKLNRLNLNAWRLPRPALALAAVLMVCLLIPTYFKLNQQLSNDYRTLSDGGQVTQNHNEIHLVFADGTTVQQMSSLLAPFAGEIVAQPTPQAIYTVRFPQLGKQDEVLNLLVQLRKNPQVVFAEPAIAELSPSSNVTVTK